MKHRIAIVDGVRTPMGKAGGLLRAIEADELAVVAVRELQAMTGVRGEEVDELIFGNGAQPSHAANIARVIALKAGLPASLPAYSVQRNCASGMESITTAANKILAGEGEVFIAGGTESMSNIPYLYTGRMKEFFTRLYRAKTAAQRLGVLSTFRFSNLRPVIGVTQGLTDPVSGMIMGETAELLAREFHITREQQDEFALLSHRRAVAAQQKGIFAEEIVPVPLPPEYDELAREDQGPRPDETMEALARLKAYFDPRNGTVTVGNSSPITDGAAAVLVASETAARRLSHTPLGYLRGYAYAALEPERMGLGPAYATARLLGRLGMSMKDIDLVEINEAFAAQVIANERAFPSREFARERLGRDQALGELDRERFNVNGGAVALGHPVGMTGARLVLHLLKELRRRGKNTGLATLCIGGGQGAALLLETD